MEFQVLSEFLAAPEKMGSRGPAPESIYIRFMRFVSKEDAGCWIWTGAKLPSGYGKFGIGSRAKGDKRSVSTHRLMWEMTRGPIPEYMCVCHKCDTPSCVNPSHLFLGTTQQNTADREAKGRSRYHHGRNKKIKGENHGLSKLSDDEALSIFMDERRPLRVIADQHGVSVATISLIKLGKSRHQSIKDALSLRSLEVIQ